MAFAVRKELGRIYLLRMVLPDDFVVYKIGISSGKNSRTRMMSLLESWFSYFRFVPYTRLRLDMECPDPQKLEKYIHKILHTKQFIPTYKVSGRTEMFVELNEIRVINFLKAYNNSMYTDPPEITEKEAKIVCRLLTSP